MIIIWRALESPDLGQAFEHLRRQHITHRKFFRVTWSWKKFQKVDESQKFRESQLAAKSQILYFVPFLKRNFACTYRMTIIWRALENPDIGQAFRYPGRYHFTYRKISRATWSREVSEKLRKFRNFESLSWLWKVKFCVFYLFPIVVLFLHIVWGWSWYLYPKILFGVNTLGLCPKSQNAKRMIKSPQPPYPARWGINHSNIKIKTAFIINIDTEKRIVSLSAIFAPKSTLGHVPAIFAPKSTLSHVPAIFAPKSYVKYW